MENLYKLKTKLSVERKSFPKLISKLETSLTDDIANPKIDKLQTQVMLLLK